MAGVSEEQGSYMALWANGADPPLFGMPAWLLFVWPHFFCQLPSTLYKKVLVIVHEKVMPHMTSPLLLSDFLTASYNIGGSCGDSGSNALNTSETYFVGQNLLQW